VVVSVSVSVVVVQTDHKSLILNLIYLFKE